MKKILFTFLLFIILVLTGCNPVKDNTGDNNDVTNPKESNDPLDLYNPLEGVDESLILSIDELFEEEYNGETLLYYFYLPEDIEIVFSIDAEFDSLVIIKDFLTNQIIFQGDDSIYGDDPYSVISFNAGEYIVEITSNNNETGSFSIMLGGDSTFFKISGNQELNNTILNDETNGYLLEIDEASYYSISSIGDLDLEAIVTSINGDFLSYNDNRNDEDENFEIIIYLEVGTYIIGVRPCDTIISGSYQIFVEETTITHITTITENTSINDTLFMGETNVVEFYVNSDGYVQIYVNSIFDSKGIIYDTDGNIVAQNDDGQYSDDFYIETFLEAGTYSIEISGYSNYDVGNYELFFNFNQNDSETNVIELDNYEIGSLLGNGQKIYVLTITEAVTVNIYSESSYDMIGTICTSSDEYITHNDDSGTNSNFLISNLYLEPGVYYIYIEEVYGYSIDYYELYVDTVEDSSIESADEVFTIDLNSNTSGILGSGELHSYTVTILNDGYITTYLESDFDSVGYITNNYGIVVANNDDASYNNDDFKIENYELSAGTYSIYIEGYSTAEYGDYTLHVSFEESTSSNTEILPNGYLAGTLLNDQINTVSFTMEQGGYIHAYLESSFDSIGSLYDIGGTFLLFDDDSGYLEDFALQGIYLNPGIYEINIAGFTSGEHGNYVLHLDIIYGDKDDAVTSLFPNDIENIMDEGDYHWYEIEILEEGYMTTYLISSFDSYGYLLDEFGQFITSDDDNYGNNDFYISWYLQPGTYYIVVRGYDDTTSGNYTLHIEFTP